MRKNKKVVEFEVKVIYKNEVYLRVADVSKALGFKNQKAFVEENGDVVIKIKGCGSCIQESDYNQLLSNDETSLQKQGQLEVTKVQTLRSKIKDTLSMMPLKMIFGGQYFDMMAKHGGYTSVEDYIMSVEVPKDKEKCIEEINRLTELNQYYCRDVEAIKDRLDIEKLKQFGLDLQQVTRIDSDGRMHLNSYIAGKGIFRRYSEYSYDEYSELYLNEDNELILNSYDDDGELFTHNLSNSETDKDFRDYHIMDNLIWCCENLDMEEGNDYEYSVLQYSTDCIDVEISNGEVIKMINPRASRDIWVEGIVDFKEETYITCVDGMQVIA